MAQQKTPFKKWWKNITGTKTVKVSGLFHVELVDSIAYAGVPVHYTVNGQTRCQGYIPTIVSKCGWFLKEKATRTQGIFRVSGSAKRVAELQLLFDTPPKYGSQLDWTGFTIHDASNVFRRYLNHLPDPVVPLEFYEKFRDVHRNLTDDDEKIAAYQELISKLPPPHSCLLMYLLDLLALFAHHSDENLMDSKNLSSVFQPGVISHPNHAMSPGEYMTSAGVLKFLIDHQSSFTMPMPSLDEEDEEMANFGLMSNSTQPSQHVGIDAGFYGGGYVNASDHERIHSNYGVSFEAEDAVHILNSGVRRQLSLHKPIVPHSTLPGSSPQRSKSTNSSTSSRHSVHGQSGLFSSAFLTRRSNRHSKSGSRILGGSDFRTSLEDVVQDPDLSDIPEDSRMANLKFQPSEPQNISIRKATTSPPIGSDESNAEFSSYLSRRKQMRAEGVEREPSVVLQTVEVQFQGPSVDRGSQESFKSSTPTSSSRGLQRASTAGALVYTPNSSAQQSDKNSPQLGPHQSNQNHRRVSHAGHAFPTQAAEYAAAAAQRPINQGMPILRAKSNPGELGNLSSSPGSQAIEKFKGLFTGKHRDNDPNSAARDSDSKDTKKDKKRESLTEKQRKYKSQEVSPGQLQGSGSVWRKPSQETINEHEGGASEGAYLRPPPPRPQQQLGAPLQQLGTPPQRPPPPPPEGSLMDLFDPPRGGYRSGHSTPSGDSRSASPARAPSSSRPPLIVNTSFTKTSSRSTLSSDRPSHTRSLASRGSSSSIEFLMPGHPTDGSARVRQHLSRAGHSPQADYHPSSHLHHESPQLISPHSSRPQYNRAHSPNHGYDATSAMGNSPSDPFYLSSRSRQGSFASIDSHDPNAPPSLGPKSKNRRSAREGSVSSFRGDLTPPPRARSNSSRNTSPAPSPSASPLTKNPSNQGGGLAAAASSGYSHHGSSPLAEGQGNNHATPPPPSSRARARAPSREEHHILPRQESTPTITGTATRPQHERERSRSTTGLAITMPSTSAPPGPMSANISKSNNNSNVSLASSIRSGKNIPPPST